MRSPFFWLVPLTLLSACEDIPPDIKLECPTGLPPIVTPACIPANQESGMKMMRPEQLHRVLLNSFDEPYRHGSNQKEVLAYSDDQNMQGPVRYDAHALFVMLGGADFTSVREARQSPAGVTPLAMFNVANQYCATLNDRWDGMSSVALQSQIYRSIRSRPLTPALRQLFFDAVDTTPAMTLDEKKHTWCRLAFMMEGGGILY